MQGAVVKGIDFRSDRAVAVRAICDGQPRTFDADYVVDASGRAGVLAVRQFKNRRPHDVFRNVAIWAYYQGGDLLPRTPSGGIDVISSPHGWYWVIPLKDEEFSVGFVTHKTQFQARRPSFASPEEMYLALVAESPTVSAMMAPGRFTGPVRVEQDYSYVADRFCGPGYFIAGDAACFLDPLMSTGVHLAMYSGMLCAAAIAAVDDEDITEASGPVLRDALPQLLRAPARLGLRMYRKYQGASSACCSRRPCCGPGRRTARQRGWPPSPWALRPRRRHHRRRADAAPRPRRSGTRLAEAMAADRVAPSAATLAPMKMDPTTSTTLSRGSAW